MISYAQQGEDALLERLLGDIEVGYYVDVGAVAAVSPSVTKHFSQRGWSGVNVASGTAGYYRLLQDRPRDVNLLVRIGPEAGEAIIPAKGDDPADSRGASPDDHRGPTHDGQAARRVPVWSIQQLIERHVRRGVDLLALAGGQQPPEWLTASTLKSWRPRVVLVYGLPPDECTPGPPYWKSSLEAADYHQIYADRRTRIYLRDEDRHRAERLCLPISILDGFEHFEWLDAKRIAREQAAVIQVQAASIADKERVIRDLEAEHQVVLAEADEKEAAIRDKNAALEQAQTESSHLAAQVQEKEAALVAALADARTLQQQLDDKNAALFRSLELSAELRTQLQEKDAALTRQMAAVADAQALNLRLDAAAREVESELAAKHAALISALTECQRLQGELIAKDQARQAALALADSLHQQAGSLQQQLLDKHAALLQALQWAEEYRQRILKMKGEVEDRAVLPPADPPAATEPAVEMEPAAHADAA